MGKAEGVVSHEQMKPGLPAERVGLEAFLAILHHLGGRVRVWPLVYLSQGQPQIRVRGVKLCGLPCQLHCLLLLLLPAGLHGSVSVEDGRPRQGAARLLHHGHGVAQACSGVLESFWDVEQVTGL